MILRLIILTLLFQQNTKRVLTVYTPGINNAQYIKQMQLFNQDKPGMANRDLVIETHVYGSQTAALYKKNHVKNTFTVTLTGKDGGEKLRSNQPLTLQKLFAVIDTMPMRRQEMNP
ncbi:DUF4174 domain-containing protein [Mucilaginibacter sp.]|uniref:DUF4174 domain-containing protein n=1 Tax=Mucilaginibacter sp. TaxID=1882438 RepID=UPI0035BBADCB